MSWLAAAVIAAAVTQAAPPPAPAVARRLITEMDLMRFQWAGDPRLSPDGRDVAFVRVAVNEKKDGYDSAIWLVPADGSAPPRVFTGGPRDTAPRWSPDGRRLAFLRAVEKDGKPLPAQIHLIERLGGEARVLTDLPKGASGIEWSPDGRTLAFLSTTTAKDLEARAKKASSAEGERESDVRVITRATYRFNGRGFLEPDRPTQVWTVAVPSGAEPPAAPRTLTSGEFPAEDVAWSKDGSRVFFTARPEKEPDYSAEDRDIFSIPVAGGAPTVVASIDGVAGRAAVAPDGRRLAFRGSVNGNPERSFDQPDLFVAEIGGAAPRNLTASAEFDVMSGLAGDQRAPRGGGTEGPVWTPDGRALYVIAAENGRANLRRIDAATGQGAAVTTGDQEVQAFSVSADGRRIVVLVSTALEIGDLFVLDAPSGAAAGAPRRITNLNQALMSELRLTPPEDVWYPSFDGKRIHTLVQRPPDYDPARTYPLILNIHGGPHAAYGYTFFHEMHWMAAKGYVVLYPNPRGSSSYGQDFGNVIQYRYPGDDYKDLMAGVDEMMRRGGIDASRLGVTGGSGGGLLTNWVVTQTDRFKAAVSQRSISDWAAFWYTADFTLFTPRWFRAGPWQDVADFAARSPITHVEKVKTPLMFIEGEADLRTPPAAGGEPMFRALKLLRRPTVMVRFPDESHELSRSGKPWHRVERLRHILAWFDAYLMGAPNPYDVPSVPPPAGGTTDSPRSRIHFGAAAEGGPGGETRRSVFPHAIR